MRIAVLGGGHGCYAAAAEMSERGHEVGFWRRDLNAFGPVLERRCIRVTDHNGTRMVEIQHPTTTLEEAIEAADLIICPLPATAQVAMARRIAPLLRSGQVCFLPPGTF